MTGPATRLVQGRVPRVGRPAEAARRDSVRSTSGAQPHPVALKVDLGDLHHDQLAFIDKLIRGLGR
ncbi:MULTISPECIES: hypothetical protein [unclassified Streptomyces]|uniref:hypothetical protein n=1 Tax=unclassified Streptomyces TaxID=2593676 RepID=UPI00342F16BB